MTFFSEKYQGRHYGIKLGIDVDAPLEDPLPDFVANIRLYGIRFPHITYTLDNSISHLFWKYVAQSQLGCEEQLLVVNKFPMNDSTCYQNVRGRKNQGKSIISPAFRLQGPEQYKLVDKANIIAHEIIDRYNAVYHNFDETVYRCIQRLNNGSFQQEYETSLSQQGRIVRQMEQDFIQDSLVSLEEKLQLAQWEKKPENLNFLTSLTYARDGGTLLEAADFIPIYGILNVIKEIKKGHRIQSSQLESLGIYHAVVTAFLVSLLGK